MGWGLYSVHPYSRHALFSQETQEAKWDGQTSGELTQRTQWLSDNLPLLLSLELGRSDHGRGRILGNWEHLGLCPASAHNVYFLVGKPEAG